MLKTAGLILALAGLLLTPGPAAAHRVNVFAYVEGQQIKGEGYFSTGSPAQNCQVEVLDGQGRPLAQARTDKQGQFALPLPSGEPPFKVVLKAGQGHQADYTLNASELGLAPAKAAAAPAQAQAPAATAPAAAAVDQAALEQALGRVLEQKLAPLKAQLARLSAGQGVTLRDVVAGLGYILGLMGLGAYVHYRRRGASA